MKINDTVLAHIQSRPYDRRSLSIGKIIGETKTAWKVKYGKGIGIVTELFRKTDLHLRGSDNFSCTHIKPWSDEEWQAYKSELLRRTIINTLSNYKWDEVNTDTLKQIHTLAHNNKIK